MDENLLKYVPLFVFIVGAVIAFYRMKNEYDKDLRKFDKDLSEKINKLEVEIERLKGRDENQQQIINQFQTQILDHLPKIYDIINNQTNNKKK